MEAVLKLRVAIWVLVLSLWGAMVYQYLGDEGLPPPMVVVRNPYAGKPLPAPDGAPVGPTRPAPPSVAPAPFVEPLPTTPPAPIKQPRLRPEAAVGHDTPVPPGFVRLVTRHFNVHAEAGAPPQDFIDLLESLHGNLMLDLAAFSPWAQDERVSVFLFRNKETYRQVTGRPPWSGGASSVPRRKVYLYASEELPGIMAHELCHIYYDSFFMGGRSNPLWLSEGMATLVQIERGLAAPEWLRENLDLLRRNGGYTLEDLMRVTSTSGADDARVRLWYTQAYSTVRFLLRSRQRSSFFNFSRELRAGRPVSEALYRSYGMPYTSVRALEHAWRYDLISTR